MLSALRTRWVLVSLSTVLYWTSSHMLIAYIPVRMNELAASDPQIGIAVGGRALLPFLLAVWVGRLSDRLGGTGCSCRPSWSWRCSGRSRPSPSPRCSSP